MKKPELYALEIGTPPQFVLCFVLSGAVTEPDLLCRKIIWTEDI